MKNEHFYTQLVFFLFSFFFSVAQERINILAFRDRNRF